MTSVAGAAGSRRSAAQANVPLTVWEGDIFSIPEKELFDNAVFCFFGGVKETLLWAKAHCRDKVLLFKKNWNTHRFTKDPEAVRRYTFPLTLEEGECFVLADSRNGGTDSRVFGPVSKSEIEGTVITIVRRNDL